VHNVHLLLKHFTKTMTIMLCSTVILLAFPTCAIGHAIKTWIKNFEETGSALKRKPPGKERSIRTPENIETVRAALEQSPQHSMWSFMQLH